MNTLVRVIAGLCSSAALGVMLHQGLLAFNRPAALVAPVERHERCPLFKVYVAILAAGWGFAGYSAGVAFSALVSQSFWYDSEGYYSNVISIGLAIVGLLVPIALRTLAALEKESAEIERLTRASTFTDSSVDPLHT